MDSTVLKRYHAQVVSEFVYGGRTRRPGEEIEIVGVDVDMLREAGLIGAIRRVPPTVEMAVVGPPEDASRNYKRKPR